MIKIIENKLFVNNDIMLISKFIILNNLLIYNHQINVKCFKQNKFENFIDHFEFAFVTKIFMKIVV